MCTVAFLEVRRRGEPVEVVPFSDVESLASRVSKLTDNAIENNVESFTVFRPVATTTRCVTFITTPAD